MERIMSYFLLNRGIYLIFFLLFISDNVWCCVGARPMGMGGAFIAVSDDINAVYWNPAGLSQLERSEATFNYNPDRWWYKGDEHYMSTYPYFIAFGSKISHYGIALTYVEVAKWAETKWSGKYWIYVACGFNVSKKLSFGFKIGYREVENPSFEFFKSPFKDKLSSVPMIFGIGVLYKWKDNLNLGVLFQGNGNVRPAIAIRPTRRLLIAYDLYDIFRVTGYLHTYRVGMEYKLTENLLLRSGFFGGQLTLGFGYSDDNFNFNYYLWTTEHSFFEYECSGVGITIKY